MENQRPIRLVVALPCSIRKGYGICGKPAFSAHLWQGGDVTEDAYQTPGLWVLQPICESCIREMLANLIGNDKE